MPASRFETTSWGDSAEAMPHLTDMSYAEWSLRHRTLITGVSENTGNSSELFAAQADELRALVEDYPQHHAKYIDSLFKEDIR